MARPRCFAGCAATRSAMPLEKTSPRDSPCRARMAMRKEAEGENAAMKETAAIAAVPIA